ncbi:MAG: hypothetical protein KGL48_09725 [Sphingomonadales bacterium]|nr:hypothetical protein [Sphingomonadales bacterium]MDE2570591.1 hypothetical protein [Sphingomonadales bacterium]
MAKARGIMWAGKATKDESLRKLDRLMSIVGKSLPQDSFDANTVDDVVAVIVAGGAKPGTVNRYLSCISAFRRFCTKRGFRTIPAPELDWREEAEGRIRWITYQEEARLMERLPASFSTVTYVAIRTGMRA